MDTGRFSFWDLIWRVNEAQPFSLNANSSSPHWSSTLVYSERHLDSQQDPHRAKRDIQRPTAKWSSASWITMGESFSVWYCSWFRNPATRGMYKSPVNNGGINHINWFSGFLPSTVCSCLFIFNPLVSPPLFAHFWKESKLDLWKQETKRDFGFFDTGRRTKIDWTSDLIYSLLGNGSFFFFFLLLLVMSQKLR